MSAAYDVAEKLVAEAIRELLKDPMGIVEELAEEYADWRLFHENQQQEAIIEVEDWLRHFLEEWEK